jgi:cobaltochelatase CobS
MRQFTNQYEKPCATCGVTVPTRAGFIRKDGRPNKRTGLPTWATYCAAHATQQPETEDDRDMSLDEITQKAGHAPGYFPTEAPVAGEVRIALRAFARLHGVPGRIANGMMSAGELRAMYNADPVGAFAQSMIEKYREAPTEAPAGEAPQPAPVPVSKPETPTAPVSTTSAGKRDRLELLKELLSAPELDEERVRQIAREEAGTAPKRIAVTITGAITKELEGAPRHEIFGKVLAALGAGLHVYLAGPAGSGKTTMAEQCAEALGIPFYFTGAIDTEYKLSGFIDAQGRCVNTAFRKAFEEGGLFLFDEIDASLPGAVLWFNAALANGYAPFPDGMVKRHAKFRCIAAANTYGHGQDRQYVGRNQLDAASLDRFVQFPMGYDENLERLVAGDTPWTRYVQKVRKAAADLKVRKVVSPRASIFGNQMLAAGIPQNEVEGATLFAGLDTDTEAKIRAHAR